MSKSILTLEAIKKIYDNGVIANEDINIDIHEGEIHAIVGENGAGKSTLMKIIFGMEQPSGGKIKVNGQAVEISDVNHAISLGIGMVHQHFMLIESFTIAENIMLNMEPTNGLVINDKESEQTVKQFADQYGFRINPKDVVQDISVGVKQKVEILKALIRGAKILILDEPTAVLTPQETVELFDQLKTLKSKGHTIIFISHKLREVKDVSDRITVIRKGKTLGTFNNADMSIQEISNRMVGRDIELNYDKPIVQYGPSLLEVKALNTPAQEGKVALRDISFNLHSGQILGMIGVDGNGQDELIAILTKKDALFTGEVRVKEQALTDLSTRQLRKGGFSYIPADRMTIGIAKDASIEENILTNRLILDDAVFLNGKANRQITQELIEEFDVVTKDGQQVISSLSGGNIQKVVVARESSVQPDLLIAEQPTRGVDLGAAEIIHKKLLALKEHRTAILLVSADITEAIRISDELMVFYEGEIVAFLKEPSNYTEEEIGEYMLGVKRQTPQEIKEAMG